jgi:hypothetical protein|nr:MAG TPA: hypothetical protein [Caudoviricetes sp.]
MNTGRDIAVVIAEGRKQDMTEARRKTLKVKDMQRRVIGKAMHAAKYGLQMRESAKTISMRTEERK